MITRQLTIINKLGLHARAAAKLVSTASTYASDVSIRYHQKTIDGKSIMAVMMLAASQGAEIEVQVEGEDELAAIDAIEALINRYFDEDE